jgi:hypothetical protein
MELTLRAWNVKINLGFAFDYFNALQKKLFQTFELNFMILSKTFRENKVKSINQLIGS